MNFPGVLMLRHSSKGVFRWPFIRKLFGTSSAAGNGWSTSSLVEIFSALSEIPLLYTDKQAALKKITELCQQAMGSRACMLTLVDLENGILTYGAGTSPDKALEAFMNQAQVRIGPRNDGYSIDRDVVRAGEVVERDNLPQDGGGIANPRIAKRHNLQTGLCHPLKFEGQLLGYLSHFSSQRGHFTQGEKELLKIFADQSVNVIERFEQAQTRDRLSKVLNELSTALLSLPPHEFLNTVAETACQLLTVPVCIVWTLDTGVDRLKVAAATPNVDEDYRRLELRREQFGEWVYLFQGRVAYLKEVRKPHRLYFDSEKAATRGWISLLSAPLQVEDHLLGMLDVYTERQPRRFKPWEQEVFHVFANYAALAMQKARFQERQLVAEIRETIDRPRDNAQRETTLSNELDDTLHRIVEQCATATEAKFCYLRLLNKATDELELKAYYDATLSQRDVPQDNKLPLGIGVAGLVAKTGQPYICPDTEHDPYYVGAQVGEKPKSVVCVPLKSGHIVIGTISIGSEKCNAFGQSGQQLLASIADSTVVAIERAHLMHSLLHLAESAAQSESLQHLLDQLVHLTQELMREPICLVWLLDKDRDGFILRSAVVPENHQCDLQGFVIKNSVPNIQNFLYRREPLYFEDASEVPGHPYRDKVSRWGWKSMLSMALIVQRQPVGFLQVYSRGEARHFTSWHCEIFKMFAAQASVAIENVSSRNKLLRLNTLMEAMADIREVDGLLQLLLKGSLALVGCTKGWVSKLDYKTGEPRFTYAEPHRPRPLTLPKPGEGITGKALWNEKPQRANNVHDPEWHGLYREQWADTQSELAVPIIMGNL
jgi:GAF domain-containing protein